ncbi:MAG: (Fe-S)-binding protein [Planctomycetes bacterium]|nr:(Fe-S)-binding protein [Planctomycetota bacterium]
MSTSTSSPPTIRGARERERSRRACRTSRCSCGLPTRAGLDAALARGPRSHAELGRVTWDDPCHLCHAQGVRKEPRALLDLVPGIERVELPGSELCCGSAGIYTMLRPADSEAIFAPKLAALDASGARVLVTANPGCQLQWETGIARERRDVKVLHLAELLERATRPADGSR